MAAPVFVTTTYQVMLVAITLQCGAKVWVGKLPFTETSFWHSKLAGTTVETALAWALTAAPLAWTPPHLAVTLTVLVVVSAQFVLRFEIVIVPPTASGPGKVPRAPSLSSKITMLVSGSWPVFLTIVM